MQTLENPEKTLDRIDKFRRVLADIEAGLRGVPFKWDENHRTANMTIAASLGLSLMTEEALGNMGYRLKKGAQMVGTIDQAGPHDNIPVYVVKCQCARKDDPIETEEAG